MAKQFAIRLSLIAFIVSIIESVFNGDSFQSGLINGGIKAVWFLGIGFVVGEIARRMIEENAALEFGLKEFKPPGAASTQ